MYTREFYGLTIKTTAIMSFTGKWTELDIIQLSEISQSHKDKYHVFCHL
jgi:hypothetical protein